MELSELTAYAEEKFHIPEQHKWADFPGFSVLADPKSGKWLALLMRQWDFDTGTEIQRCDIKCGREVLSEDPMPFLSLPFRMHGKKWVGVALDARTEPDVVFRLFDRAVYTEEQRGYTLVLETPSRESTVVYQDTALSTVGEQFVLPDPDVPERIRQMRRLYQYDNGSLEQKSKIFCLQGKFMEDYEDDAPWNGTFRRYFPTYHDLNLRQLRGYFTWRTQLRNGNFTPIATSLAYIYLYELLNGIGTNSPEDTLKKMREFESGFLDSGVGDQGMRTNVRRWMLEYAVLHDVPPEMARKYVDPNIIKRDDALVLLRDPEEVPDEELFSALCVFGGGKLEQSTAVTRGGARGLYLFAETWRLAANSCTLKGKNLFSAIFGPQDTFVWHPLSNAVYWEEHSHPDTDYALDPCRAYSCRSGVWRSRRYDNLYFEKNRFQALLHESDRLIRQYLKTGHYLREKPAEAWATPYVEQAIRNLQQAELDAARAKIAIDLSHLEQIRQDALRTRDSLLTEEELDSSEEKIPNTQVSEEQPPQGTQDIDGNAPAAPDIPYGWVLLALLRGEAVEAALRAKHLMPSVVADTINDALFDEIGDSALECDGERITLVEDYREDIVQMLGGKSE